MADSSSFEQKAHEQTYVGFTKFLKYGAIASFLVAAVVVYLIAR